MNRRRRECTFFRNQRVEEEHLQDRSESLERPAEPRIHPMELIGPPTYEEAVHMPRLTHSMDALNEIVVENGSVNVIMGSVDNLRMKKRRTRRARKRTQSEDDLLRREERRHERLRRERNSIGNVLDVVQPQDNTNPRNPRTTSARRSRRYSLADESIESSSGRDRPRPQTPNAKKRRRKHINREEHVADDEDSDVPTFGSVRSVVIKELKREPRSGYRESSVRHET